VNSPKQKHSLPDSQAGFTLLELMVVLALMALLMGLVFPSLLQSWQREKTRAALRGLVVALRTARSEAVTSSNRIRVFLDLRTGRFWLEGTERGGSLTGLSLAEPRLVWLDPDKSQGYVAFYGDGSSSGGSLVLQEASGRKNLLEIKTITGKVSLSTTGN
jgi:general secretion pathway protein H